MRPLKPFQLRLQADIAALTEAERLQLNDWQRDFLQNIATALENGERITPRQEMFTLETIKRVKGQTR